MNDKQILESAQLFLSIATALIASSGFWTYIMQKKKEDSALKKLLIGIAHDRITFLCMLFINRGYISRIEYENLNTFLYEPYLTIGGNGTAKRLMDEVHKLPIKTGAEIAEMKESEGEPMDDN